MSCLGPIAGALGGLAFCGLVGAGMYKLHLDEVEQERVYQLPENCRPYAEEPGKLGASCPRRVHRAHIERLGNGGALLVCECPDPRP